jgi:predicted amidohydrolase
MARIDADLAVWRGGGMKVFCCQHDIAWEDKAATFSMVEDVPGQESFPAGALLILPEMFSTGFSFDLPRIAEGEARLAEQFLADVAKACGVFAMGGVVNLGADGRGRNECVVFSPEGSEVARYAKMQPFTPGGEAAHFTAGDGPVTFAWGECRVAPFICYDLRFPEIFRPVARAGAQLITVIASWPEARIGQWVKLLQARAIENQCYVAGVNRVGTDPRFRYTGRSMIVDYRGDVIADAGTEANLISAELDLAGLTEYRRELPFLADMREDVLRAAGPL